MKIIFTILTSISFVCSMNAQEETMPSDFLEATIHTTFFIRSNYLYDQAEFADVVKNPLDHSEGLEPKTKGANPGLKVKYGKAISKKSHVLFELGYIERVESARCFCHYCDKVIWPRIQIDRVKSIDTGVGIRHVMSQRNNHFWAIELVGNYSISTNKKQIKYFGAAVSQVFGVSFRDQVDVIAKMGLERSLDKYDKLEGFIDVGMAYKI